MSFYLVGAHGDFNVLARDVDVPNVLDVVARQLQKREKIALLSLSNYLLHNNKLPIIGNNLQVANLRFLTLRMSAEMYSRTATK